MRKSTTALLAAALCGLLGGCMTAERRQELIAAHTNRMEAGLAAGRGVVLLDADFDQACSDVTVDLLQAADLSPQPRAARPRGTAHISSTEGAELIAIDAGDWLVSSVTCHNYKHTKRVNGPHAVFRVKPGEVVNVGKLHVEATFDSWFVQVAGTLKKQVQPVPDKVVERNRLRYPAVVARMANRPMGLLGPEEGRFKRQCLLCG